MNIVYVEYDLPGPNRMPWSAAPDKEGSVWMPYYGGANKIGKLDPETGNVKEYDVPNPNAVGIHSAYPGPDGNVWLGEFGINKIGKFDPKTEKLTEYADAYTPGKEGLVAGRKQAHRAGRCGRDCLGEWNADQPPRSQDGEIHGLQRADLWRRVGQGRQLLVLGIQCSRKNRENRWEDFGREDLESSRKQHGILTPDPRSIRKGLYGSANPARDKSAGSIPGRNHSRTTLCPDRMPAPMR